MKRKPDFYMMAPTNIYSLEVNINNTKVKSVIILYRHAETIF